MIVLAAFISPYREDREYIKKQFEGDNFLEIYVKCSVEECERRDPKGQYKKARVGIIREYTGISSPYEEPEDPDLILDTEKYDVKTSVKKVIELFNEKNFFISLDQKEIVERDKRRFSSKMLEISQCRKQRSRKFERIVQASHPLMGNPNHLILYLRLQVYRLKLRS